MFGGAIRLPIRMLGIPVRLDTSFLLVLPLFAWLIAHQLPGYLDLLGRAGFDVAGGSTLLGGVTPYLLGLMAAIGLFTGVVIHELGHAVVARLYDVEVKEITLWFLGGVAQFDELPRQRGAEALVGIAGPITSLVLAALCWLAWQYLPMGPGGLFIFSYLTLTNLALALFNLLPALPLDGGRILRSLLALWIPYLRATRIAAGVSRVVALLLGVYGFFTFQLLLVVVAFFVYNAVAAETRYAAMTAALQGKFVSDLMTRDVMSVTADMPLGKFLQLANFRRHVGYPVIDDYDHLLGFARLDDAREADPDERVERIVRPAETIVADADAMDAVKLLSAGELGRLMVLDRYGRLVGILSKTDVVRALHGLEKTGRA
ncbi:MAG TPA: site-2 protease family protein [Trueperaceae bacterium]